jgi:hypothetical protein
MKTYEQLTDEQKQMAVDYCLGKLLEAIIEGAIRFNDKLNQDDLQSRIDKAVAKADGLHTPWFAHEHILDTCRDDLTGMAQCEAEDAMYSEPTENVIRLSALNGDR